MHIIFLTTENVLRLHARQIAKYGGDPGLRDPGLLDSALAMPQQSFGGQYLHPTLAEMAAAYLFYLCRNHAFIDGNKRIATIAALTFLCANGVTVAFNPAELTTFVLDVASGRAGKPECTAFFQKHLAP